MSPVFTIRKTAAGWAVLDAATGLWRTGAASYDAALTRAVKPASAPMLPGRRYAAGPLPATERPCISCSQPFASKGPHNRMCASCRQTALGKEMLG